MWTDQRLSEQFEAIDERFDRLERRMDDGFARIDGRLDALQRTMLQTNAIIIAALIGIIATQL